MAPTRHTRSPSSPASQSWSGRRAAGRSLRGRPQDRRAHRRCGRGALGERAAAVVRQDRQRRHGHAHDDDARRRAGCGAGECLDPGAARSRCALVTPWGYATFRTMEHNRNAPISIPTGPSTGPATPCTSRASCARNRTTRWSCQGRRQDAHRARTRQQRGAAKQELTLSPHGT
jgi:hypothetical protein